MLHIKAIRIRLLHNSGKARILNSRHHIPSETTRQIVSAKTQGVNIAIRVGGLKTVQWASRELVDIQAHQIMHNVQYILSSAGARYSRSYHEGDTSRPPSVDSKRTFLAKVSAVSRNSSRSIHQRRSTSLLHQQGSSARIGSCAEDCMCLFDSELPLFLGGAGNYLEYMVWHLGGCYLKWKLFKSASGNMMLFARPFFSFLVFVSS